jgi:hypothetical protein
MKALPILSLCVSQRWTVICPSSPKMGSTIDLADSDEFYWRNKRVTTERVPLRALQVLQV